MNLGAVSRMQVNIMVQKATFISHLNAFEDGTILPVGWIETVRQCSSSNTLKVIRTRDCAFFPTVLIGITSLTDCQPVSCWGQTRCIPCNIHTSCCGTRNDVCFSTPHCCICPNSDMHSYPLWKETSKWTSNPSDKVNLVLFIEFFVRFILIGACTIMNNIDQHLFVLIFYSILLRTNYFVRIRMLMLTLNDVVCMHVLIILNLHLKRHQIRRSFSYLLILPYQEWVATWYFWSVLIGACPVKSVFLGLKRMICYLGKLLKLVMAASTIDPFSLNQFLSMCSWGICLCLLYNCHWRQRQ